MILIRSRLNRARDDINKYIALRRVILFCAILLTGGNLLIPRIALIGAILVISTIYFGTIRHTLNKQKLLIYLWLIVVMGLGFFQLQDLDLVTNFTRIINFIVGMFLLQMYWGEKSENLKGDLRALIWPMAYQAILTVMLAFMLPNIFMTVQFESLKFQSLVGLFNYHVLIEGASQLVRPDGFFFEPGVFQIYLNILLYILFVDRAPWWRILLVVLAVFLTQSTTGVLIATLLMSYFGLIQMYSKLSNSKRVLHFFIIAVMAIPIYSVVENNLHSKLSGEFVGSANAREYDLTSGLKLIRENPIIGIGFNHEKYLLMAFKLNPYTDLLSEANQAGRASTNGLLATLYSTGLPLGIIYLLAFFRQTLLPHKIIFAAVLLISLATEALSFAPLFAFFAFNGLARKPSLRWKRSSMLNWQQRQNSEFSVESRKANI